MTHRGDQFDLMRLPSRTIVTWLLAAAFAVVGGFGEGLHFVPGLGHAVELPGGLFYLGLEKPRSAPSGNGSRADVSRLPGGPPLVLDEDQCAICGHFSRGQCVAQPVEFVLALPFLEWLSESSLPGSSASVSCPFDARAPPVA